MTQFIGFGLYLCLSAMLLIVVPVLMHPTLPLRRKMLLCCIAFFVLVPAGLALYAWLGAPDMAATS
jgi:hypothetical protein